MSNPERFVSEHVLISLRDGQELSASMLRCRDVDRAPALVSFTPYRADDVAGASRGPHRKVFAAAGYHELLVDLRGYGSSGGQSWEAWDTLEEGRDAADAVEWIARQPWCDGNVGVWGLSYGAITIFNLAPYQPEGLRACVGIYGTPDIYADFLYPGGIPNAAGNAVRDALMLAMELAPPSHRNPEGRWLDIWDQHLDRLRRGKPWSLRWLEHPHYDAHWQRRTADCSAIETPTFLIGGWHDIFPEATLRAYEQLGGEKRLVLGPWMHVMPDYAEREPWDWQSEAVAWFDHWLRGTPDESTHERVRLFVEGRDTWVGLADIARDGEAQHILYLGPNRTLCDEAPAVGASDDYVGLATVGSEGELYDPMGLGIGLAPPQANDLRDALVYIGEPLGAAIELRGAPHLSLTVELLEGDDLQLVAKLLEIRPDGVAQLVTTGWLNGQHRAGRADQRRVEPGAPLAYELPLWSAARRIEAGSRLGLMLSVSDFPRCFPTILMPRIRVHTGGDTASHLRLPLAESGRPVTLRRPAVPYVRTDSVPQREVRREPSGAVTTKYGTAFDATCDGVGLQVRFTVEAGTAPGPRSEATVHASATIQIEHPDGSLVIAEADRQATRDAVRMRGTVTVDGDERFAGSWDTDEGA